MNPQPAILISPYLNDQVRNKTSSGGRAILICSVSESLDKVLRVSDDINVTDVTNLGTERIRKSFRMSDILVGRNAKNYIRDFGLRTEHEGQR